eukprot:964845_1
MPRERRNSLMSDSELSLTHDIQMMDCKRRFSADDSDLVLCHDIGMRSHTPVKRTLSHFVGCLELNGVPLPSDCPSHAPRTHSTGDSGIDWARDDFKKAMRCRERQRSQPDITLGLSNLQKSMIGSKTHDGHTEKRSHKHREHHHHKCSHQHTRQQKHSKHSAKPDFVHTSSGRRQVSNSTQSSHTATHTRRPLTSAGD